jgi:hypothetical protein
MSYDGTFITLKNIYLLSYNKYLSCLTKDYYDPKFAVNTICNYVRTFVKDNNPYIEEMKHCISFEDLFEEYCKNNLGVDKYIDSSFNFVQKYGKLMKILKNIPDKPYRNIYNLQQWLHQCKYICNKISEDYSIGLEASLIIYYIRSNTKRNIEDIYNELIDNNIFTEDIETISIDYIKNVINGSNNDYMQEIHNIFISSITLPPATCNLIFHSVNCFINKRSLKNTNYITYINKVSSYGLNKNQNNPIYKYVFSNELQKEQNIISAERYNILYKSKNKIGYWMSDKLVKAILKSRYSDVTIKLQLAKKIHDRLSRARKLGINSSIGYTPLMEFLVILDSIKGFNQDIYDEIYTNFIHTALFKYGYNILDKDVLYYLKKLDKNKIDDEILEVVYYSKFNAPHTKFSEYIEYFRKHGNDGRASMYKYERFIVELKNDAILYVHHKHPSQKSKLYTKSYVKELERYINIIATPLIYDEGVVGRVIGELNRIDNARKITRERA